MGKLFSRVTVSDYIPASSVCVIWFLCILASIWYYHFFILAVLIWVAIVYYAFIIITSWITPPNFNFLIFILKTSWQYWERLPLKILSKIDLKGPYFSVCFDFSNIAWTLLSLNYFAVFPLHVSFSWKLAWSRVLFSFN